MMKHDLELKVQAWLDNELSDREAEQVAKWVAADPAAQQLVAELKNTVSALRQNELDRVLPESGDFYWSKIKRQIQQEEREKAITRPSIFGWRKFLIPVASAAAMIALLLVSVEQFGPAPDEVTELSGEMQSLTFHDHEARMTVVWLQERHAEPELDFELD